MYKLVKINYIVKYLKFYILYINSIVLIQLNIKENRLSNKFEEFYPYLCHYFYLYSH